MTKDCVKEETEQRALESVSDPLLKRSPLLSPETEKMLSLLNVDRTLQLKPNFLLKSAQVLLSFASSCRGEVPPIPEAKVKEKLVEAIHQFMMQVKTDGYDTFELMAGRYLLAALLDDLIAQSSWELSTDWMASGLLNEFAQEPISSGRFFEILKGCCDDPSEHLDLLELGYYCLSLGFMGEYRDQAGGIQVIAQMRDRLYRYISLFRGAPKAVFFWGDKPNIPRKKSLFSKFWRARGMGIIWFMVLLATAVLYIPYQKHLHGLAKPLHDQLQAHTVTHDMEAHTDDR